MTRFWLSALTFLCLAVLVAAQSDETAGQYPSCAALEDGLCSPGNTTCICTDESFQESVSQCISESCTIPDALASQNASLTACGAPFRDRSEEYSIVSISLICAAGLCVFLRFGYKMFFTKLKLALDDWLILATLFASTVAIIITMAGATKNGLGRDIWTLSSDEITRVLRYFYMMAWLYFINVTLLKLSFIAFYLRIFPAKDVHRVLWGTFIFTVLWGIAYTFTAIFQCKPISYFWTRWDGLHSGTCLGRDAISWSNAAINIALDLWILAVPLWKLRELELHWKKKIGVIFMFCIGTFVTVVSMLRLQSLIYFATHDNVTWHFYSVSFWSTIEIGVGMMCACLPTLRLILVRIFPVLGASTGHSHAENRGGYGSGPRPAEAAEHGTVGIVVVDRRDSEPEMTGDGIVLEKTYDVQYSDDEENLVHMNELDARGRTVGKA